MSKHGLCQNCGTPLKRPGAAYCSNPECSKAKKRAYYQNLPDDDCPRNATLAEIQEFRRDMGLRLLKPGKIECLECGRIFKSSNTVTIRRCNRCKHGEVQRIWNPGPRAHAVRG